MYMYGLAHLHRTIFRTVGWMWKDVSTERCSLSLGMSLFSTSPCTYSFTTDNTLCCQAFTLPSCYSEVIKNWKAWQQGYWQWTFFSIQFPASQPRSINGILHHTACSHLPIHGATIPIPLPACLQGKFLCWFQLHACFDVRFIFVCIDNSFIVNFKIDHRLAWSERKKILYGSACGLAYLHSSTPPFVHHDVKSWVFSSLYRAIASA